MNTVPILRRVACFTAAIAALACITASAATRYVWQDSPSPGPPYATWATLTEKLRWPANPVALFPGGAVR